MEPKEIAIYNIWAYSFRKYFSIKDLYKMLYSTIKYGETGNFLPVEYSLGPQSHKCVLFQKWIMVIRLTKSWKNCENFGADTYYIHVNLVIGTKDRLYSWLRVWITPWRSSGFCGNSLILKIAVAGQLVVTLDESLNFKFHFQTRAVKVRTRTNGQHLCILKSPRTSSCATQPCPTAGNSEYSILCFCVTCKRGHEYPPSLATLELHRQEQ